jgi:hypothetical protein
MPTRTTAATTPPARTHQQAIELFRRPFAPGAIGFRAMTKVPYDGDPWGGAQVAAYLNAQSVIQRLNCVVPGRWRQEFGPLEGDLLAASADRDRRSRLYLACRLIVTLPIKPGGPDSDAVYEDVGELDAGSVAGLKALYSDARKRAGVAAGIGAYLYTALEPVTLPIGPAARQVQCIRRSGKSDLLTLSAETEHWLRGGYRTRIGSPAVVRDLGDMLAHGEPEDGMGQGERTDDAARPGTEAPQPDAPPTPASAAEHTATARPATGNGDGDLVTIDFGGLGPAGPPPA